MLDIPEVIVAHAALDGGPLLQHMRQIADMGVRIAVDDVGTGPAAPNAPCPRCRCRILKIDGRFVRALRSDAEAQLVPAMIGLAHEMGLLALAENVEHEEEPSTSCATWAATWPRASR